MLQKMHPDLWKKFGNQIHLNQKFHPQMTGKFINDVRASQTPNSRKGEIILLQGPVQPKPPAFHEQAYQGREDWRKKSASQSQARPYTAYANNDAQAYMSQQKLKKQQERQQKTLDPYQYRNRAMKIKKNILKKEEDEEWERFNEQMR